jgi:hypothetical protein
LYLLPPVVFTIQRDQVPYTFLFKDIWKKQASRFDLGSAEADQELIT